MNMQTVLQVTNLGARCVLCNEAPPDGGDGGGSTGGSEPIDPPDNGGGDDGDEGLEPDGSLLGGDDGGKGGDNASVDPPKDDTPTEMSDDEYVAAIKLTEDLGKNEDGSELTLNADVMKELTPALRAAGLNTEQASALATAYYKIEQAQLKQFKEKSDAAKAEYQASIKAKRLELREQSEKALNAEDLTYAKRAIDRFKTTDPVFYKQVHTSLLSDHPSFLKLCAEAGRRIADDGLPNPNGVGGGAQAKTRGERLFAAQIAAGHMRA